MTSGKNQMENKMEESIVADDLLSFISEEPDSSVEFHAKDETGELAADNMGRFNDDDNLTIDFLAEGDNEEMEIEGAKCYDYVEKRKKIRSTPRLLPFTNTTEPQEIKYNLTHGNAQVPRKGTRDSAGFDLFPCERMIIAPKSSRIVKTGLQIKMPSGMYGLIVNRSGLTIKRGLGLTAGTGVIDPDFEGNIQLSIDNRSSRDYLVDPDTRIAQILFMPYFPTIRWKSSPTSFTNSVVSKRGYIRQKRGSGGFGSTGGY